MFQFLGFLVPKTVSLTKARPSHFCPFPSAPLLLLAKRWFAPFTIVASLLVTISCSKTKEIELEPVDANTICDAILWNQFHTKQAFEEERSQIKYGASQSDTSPKEVEAILSSLKSTEKTIRDIVSTRCTSVPQRVFDCLPYADDTLSELANVLEKQEKRSGVPKDCKNAAKTLTEAIRPTETAKAPKTAKIKWHTKLKTYPRALAQDETGVYVATETLDAFDMEGKPLWSESVRQVFSLVLHDQNIVVFSKEGVIAFDKSNGAQRWNIAAPDQAWLAAAVLMDERLYFLASSGELLAYKFGISCGRPGPCLQHEVSLSNATFENNYQLLASPDNASLVAIADSKAYVLNASLELQTVLQGHDRIPLAALTSSGTMVVGMGDEYILLDPKHCISDKPIALKPSQRLRLRLLAGPSPATLPCETCIAPPQGCEVARHHFPRQRGAKELAGAVVGTTLLNREGHLYGLSLDDLSLLWSHPDNKHGVGNVIPGHKGNWYELDVDGNVQHGDQSGVSHSITALPWIAKLPKDESKEPNVFSWETRGVSSVYKDRLALATTSIRIKGPKPEFHLTVFGD